MFKSKPNYVKLRTNLKIVITRMKHLEKKKTELALKARKEIADYIKIAKDDRARIRVEHIIREDYLVEAMEIVEMFCDLLLARFGVIEKMSEMDPGLEEAISTIIWVTNHMSSDVKELKDVEHQFAAKYGKEFVAACQCNANLQVNEKVLQKMSIHGPPKKLIEQYLIEISKSFDVPFTPDQSYLLEDELKHAQTLINIGGNGAFPPASQSHLDSGCISDPSLASGEIGGPRRPVGWTNDLIDLQPTEQKSGMDDFTPTVPGPPYYTPPASAPSTNITDPNSPYMFNQPQHPGSPSTSFPAVIPSSQPHRYYPSTPPPSYTSFPPTFNDVPPIPPPRDSSNSAPYSSGAAAGLPDLPELPPAGTHNSTFSMNLPSVPNDGDSAFPPGDDIDFDDLTKRFEELKKKK